MAVLHDSFGIKELSGTLLFKHCTILKRSSRLVKLKALIVHITATNRGRLSYFHPAVNCLV